MMLTNRSNLNPARWGRLFQFQNWRNHHVTGLPLLHGENSVSGSVTRHQELGVMSRITRWGEPLVFRSGCCAEESLYRIAHFSFWFHAEFGDVQEGAGSQ